MFSRGIKLKPVGLLLLIGLILLYITLPTREKTKKVINLKQLLIIGLSAAIEGGNEVVNVIQNKNLLESSKGKTAEGANDPVTNADYKSHCVMYNKFLTNFPVTAVISEEDIDNKLCNINVKSVPLSDALLLKISKLPDDSVNNEDVTVWIDPLDATQEFTESLFHQVSTMVCIAVKGKPIIGIIHRPFQSNEPTSWAWIGKASSNNLYVSSNKNMNEPLVIVSRSHAGKIKQTVDKAFESKAKIIAAGGAGYKVLQVVSGNATAYIHSTNIKKWDICAGEAILTAVGGRMSTLKNENIDYSSNSNVVNKDGILATVWNHDWYYSKLNTLKNLSH